jgi:hypothetical protein
MWPRALPPEVRDHPLRAAERKVYDRLAATLDGSWVVFYSRPWLGLTPTGEEIDGECDFVVARADSGILALEVKGGAVSHDPATGAWTSRDRHGFRHRIKNPVAQARSSKYELLRKLKESPAWRPRRVHAQHGVILPDSARPPADLGADMPLSIFCFLEDFERSLPAWLEARLGNPGQDEEPLGRNGIAALEQLLAKPFSLRTPLAHLIREDERTFQTLTPQQYHILELLQDVPRAAVAGGAGTGKTIVAMEKARRCADGGLRTLLTCFNRPLADHMAASLGATGGVEVTTFHALCKRKAEAAGISIPGGVPERVLLSERFPELLMAAADARPDLRYDAIVVDEGQDFEEHWWPALEAVLDPSGPAQLYVFLDSNQSVYGRAAKLPADVRLVPIRLSRNLRNTKRIHALSSRHYSGPPIEAIGPEGADVAWTDTSGGLLRRALDACVARYVGHEGIAPADIVVLFSRGEDLAKAVESGRLGGCPIAPAGTRKPGAISADTVRRFKGLERPVVVLVADEYLVSDRELAYVGLSRARSHLAVVGERAFLEALRPAGDVGT